MGITERRQREKQATREGILRAARTIAKAEGWDAVTIRRVAAEIEYTPPVIYEYFPGKIDILAELQQEGFQVLAQQMQSAKDKNRDSADRTDGLLAMGDAYWRFAHEQPELYNLMHGSESAAIPEEKTLAGANQTAAVFQEALGDWAKSEGSSLTDTDSAVELAWALLHGMISVEMLGRIGGEKQNRAQLLCRRALRDLLDAWKSRGSVL
jgi:AcrR family transcriptional regulator